MERVLLHPTCFEIQNYERGESEKLESYFQVYDPICHKQNDFGLYYDEVNEKLTLSHAALSMNSGTNEVESSED